MGAGHGDSFEVPALQQWTMALGLLSGRLQRVPVGERDGRLEGILDLPSIPPVPVFPMAASESQDLVMLEVHGHLAFRALALLLQEVEVHLPYLPGVGLVEGRIVQRAVHAGFDRLVEVAHVDGGEDQDAGVILEDAQED